MSAASTEKSETTEAKNSAEEKKAATEKTVGAEMATIEKAKAILTEGVKAFLQTGAKTHTKRDDARRNQAVAILRKLARSSHVYALSQLAAHATSDTFGKVKGLIEAMI